MDCALHLSTFFIGMKVLYKTFPEGILSGVVPDSCKVTSAGSGRAKKPQFSSVSCSTAHREAFTQEDLVAIQDKLDDALLSGKY